MKQLTYLQFVSLLLFLLCVDFIDIVFQVYKIVSLSFIVFKTLNVILV